MTDQPQTTKPPAVIIQCEGCLREFYDWQPHVVTEDDCWLCEECADVE